MDACRALIHENISYVDLIREYPCDADVIDGYVELMVDACCTWRETIRVNQEDFPAAVVRGRFLKLDRKHILYVMEAMRRNTTQAANIRACTLSVLYNAPMTMGQYAVDILRTRHKSGETYYWLLYYTLRSSALIITC